ncbi:N-acetyl-gamma-glutamyl-phosphate reductase [Hyphomonas sp. WL0036]|uniref:N-acetyl-gamma-glutamyl-phosphate reductase n=1 Tax=Hyphomonas sediminis TaxID=2866160 RepID=UPI001C7EE37C|nr:N-acetyl-gamma-glutamyl-phosphate reductase [Hyphomonas sediminis]MBY9067987.1 N-acetyl-gamma-glutamyl-phosphate reductase [Hyphomonas sediminis]
MLPKVFIDGEAGTTGLQIADRLKGRRDLELISIDPDKRKDVDARAAMINKADAVILCLPDDASRLAVSLVTNPNTVVIDASTAHRTSSGWIYGFAEMDKAQRASIAAATRISNPGCYPTGFIALVRPLVVAGIIPADWPVTVNAVSGYSGGGKPMIAEFEERQTEDNFRIYALGQQHKHPPEMKKFTGLSHTPMFTPAVGRYAQGMIVEVPLPLWALPSKAKRKDVHKVLTAAYANERFIKVATLAEADAIKSLDAEGCNDTNRLEIYVFGTDEQARLVARLDNLGKGASGAAVQNLNIALGLDEGAGLVA